MDMAIARHVSMTAIGRRIGLSTDIIPIMLIHDGIMFEELAERHSESRRRMDVGIPA